MNTPEVNTQSKSSTAHQELGKSKEELEMKTATLTEKVNMWLHEHLAMKTPIKLLGGLALGALVITAIALPFGLNYADEPSRPFTSGQYPGCFEIDGGCYDPHAWHGFDALSDPALTTGTSISGVQFEEWPEVGFDSYTYHRFMVNQRKAASPSRTVDYSLVDWEEMSLDLGAERQAFSPTAIAQTECYPELDIC